MPLFFGGAKDTRGDIDAQVFKNNKGPKPKGVTKVKAAGGSKGPAGWPNKRNYAHSEGLREE